MTHYNNESQILNITVRMHFKIICGSSSTYYFDEQGLSKIIPWVHSRVLGRVLKSVPMEFLLYQMR